MTLHTLLPQEVQEKQQQGAVLIDIRSPDEYRREHIAGALLQPLPTLQAQGLPPEAQHAETLIFHCKSGFRTQHAAPLLAQLASKQTVFIMEGGLEAWKQAGLPTVLNRAQPLEIMRQVQIVAGGLILLGAVLGWLLSPAFYALCAFVGAGLMVAGITGFCGMARLLAVMPWNKIS